MAEPDLCLATEGLPAHSQPTFTKCKEHELAHLPGLCGPACVPAKSKQNRSSNLKTKQAATHSACHCGVDRRHGSLTAVPKSHVLGPQKARRSRCLPEQTWQSCAKRTRSTPLATPQHTHEPQQPAAVQASILVRQLQQMTQLEIPVDALEQLRQAVLLTHLSWRK